MDRHDPLFRPAGVFGRVLQGQTRLELRAMPDCRHLVVQGLGEQRFAGRRSAFSSVMSSNQADQQVLYVELRRNGDPINPLPWIAARNSEMSGG